jgi:hypothetical protein
VAPRHALALRICSPPRAPIAGLEQRKIVAGPGHIGEKFAFEAFHGEALVFPIRGLGASRA